ncbi:MAG: hypothetical protein ACI4RO_02645 [Candidatus Scatosoma sp.]
MEKKWIKRNLRRGAVAFAAVLALSINAGIVPASAEEADNLLYESDWKLNPCEGRIEFSSMTASFTPKNVHGATYTEQMGDGTISFNYQVEYPEDLLSTGDAPFKAENAGDYPSFFGVTFLNTPEGVTSASGTISVPFQATGGFPYMVAFDYEPQTIKSQNETQFSQLGLTLRRYKYGGGHDFTKWSTVNPTNDIYYNNVGNAYESKIPAFSKPVTVDTAFDGNAHDVSIGIESLYTENGDEYDAIKIDVTFDGELCLTVIDEMPFISDYLATDFPMDKRGTEGFVSIYCYNGDSDFENYTLKMNSFSIEFADGKTPQSKPEQKGCGGVAGIGGISATTVLLGAAFIAKKRKDE